MQRQNAPENIVQKMDVSLEQIYNEESVQMTYKQKIVCAKCDGHLSECGPCRGKGVRVQIMQLGPGMMTQTVGACSNCNGKGTVSDEKNKCTECDGNTFTIRDKTISIPLKAGLSNGNKINLSGKGHQLKGGKTDLIIVINEVPHKVFKRFKDDLYVDVDVKLYQALFGFDKIITHLDGRKLHISCSSKSDVDTIRKINNEGMKSINGSSKGNLYIRFKMNLPNLVKLPTDTKTQIKTVLQSFDKGEVQTENGVKTSSNLVKTILNDCKIEETEQILNLLHDMKNFNESDGNDNDQGQEQPQCVQQ